MRKEDALDAESSSFSLTPMEFILFLKAFFTREILGTEMGMIYRPSVPRTGNAFLNSNSKSSSEMFIHSIASELRTSRS